MVTIKQIAELCGVSRGTVDRVLNGRGKVKPEKNASCVKWPKNFTIIPILQARPSLPAKSIPSSAS